MFLCKFFALKMAQTGLSLTIILVKIQKLESDLREVCGFLHCRGNNLHFYTLEQS